MPASENMKTAIAAAKQRLLLRQTCEVIDLLDRSAVATKRKHAGKHTERHHQIDRDIDENALHPLLGAGGETDQGKADMADAAIGQEAFDVALADRGERTEQHRGDRDEHHDLLPLARPLPERLVEDADGERHGRDLGGGGEEGGDRGGSALVDVGRPHVEGHGGELEGEACGDEHQADDHADADGATLADFPEKEPRPGPGTTSVPVKP